MSGRWDSTPKRAQLVPPTVASHGLRRPRAEFHLSRPRSGRAGLRAGRPATGDAREHGTTAVYSLVGSRPTLSAFPVQGRGERPASCGGLRGRCTRDRTRGRSVAEAEREPTGETPKSDERPRAQGRSLGEVRFQSNRSLETHTIARRHMPHRDRRPGFYLTRDVREVNADESGYLTQHRPGRANEILVTDPKAAARGSKKQDREAVVGDPPTDDPRRRTDPSPVGLGGVGRVLLRRDEVAAVPYEVKEPNVESGRWIAIEPAPNRIVAGLEDEGGS